ncbi:hypothetical protein, variant [Cladophialophora immunda]|uniref:Uncharacterized protein n=1 Tax=Cladophialophora immunda TaxID=569365 RepID=A0A0D2C2J3_9EURO|nr:uncharacterized protein PV07_08629 [Cladophialophora immunda]XP_016245674.1 hypothetical protein, variant [Cladophialophora immunda]KIW25457.1 hypothetical protein PV07_08629 [Cladophialophora immunda]KIW25458.1 hypothetical protein, variant [Cladophialophora immunda]
MTSTGSGASLLVAGKTSGQRFPGAHGVSNNRTDPPRWTDPCISGEHWDSCRPDYHSQGLCDPRRLMQSAHLISLGERASVVCGFLTVHPSFLQVSETFKACSMALTRTCVQGSSRNASATFSATSIVDCSASVPGVERAARPERMKTAFILMLQRVLRSISERVDGFVTSSIRSITTASRRQARFHRIPRLIVHEESQILSGSDDRPPYRLLP